MAAADSQQRDALRLDAMVEANDVAAAVKYANLKSFFGFSPGSSPVAISAGTISDCSKDIPAERFNSHPDASDSSRPLMKEPEIPTTNSHTQSSSSRVYRESIVDKTPVTSQGGRIPEMSISIPERQPVKMIANNQPGVLQNLSAPHQRFEASVPRLQLGQPSFSRTTSTPRGVPPTFLTPRAGNYQPPPSFPATTPRGVASWHPHASFPATSPRGVPSWVPGSPATPTVMFPWGVGSANLHQGGVQAGIPLQRAHIAGQMAGNVVPGNLPLGMGYQFIRR